MAKIDSKVIFVTTSPRTPTKMIPEIELLNTHFYGKKWNAKSQQAFMKLLKKENFFNETLHLVHETELTEPQKLLVLSFFHQKLG
jgi:hypothetical protein